MKIGIVGWGVEGQSAYKYFGPDHDYLIVNEEPRDDFPTETARVSVKYINSERQPGTPGNVSDLSYLEGINGCDKVVYTISNAKNLEEKFGKNSTFWSKATTTQHIFFEQVKTKNIVGVTGTKGKGTTSTLIYEMLKAAGQTVFLGGNIGVPVLDFVRLIQPNDWVILELSSFQLYNLTYSPHIGVCLMIAPEHLEWHDDMTDYVEAKANLFRHQKPDDIAIYFSGNTYSKHIAGYSQGHKIPYFAKPGAVVRADRKIVVGEEETEIISLEEIKLLGEHNQQNICAALTAVWQIDQNAEAYRQVLSTFSGLEHRLEFVRELDGVKYYDDSFGTTPDTAIVAMRAFPQPKVIIVGGYDRGVPMDSLIEELTKERVRHVIAIGQTGKVIADALEEKGFLAVTMGMNDMEEIVHKARQKARAGDVVLLSAGASSFDMFKNFKERGQKFKDAVNKL